MPYFDRARKLSTILFWVFVVFLLLTFYAHSASNFQEIIMYNYTNDLRGTIATIVCLMISLLALIGGISLRCIVADAKEELNTIPQQFREQRENRSAAWFATPYSIERLQP